MLHCMKSAVKEDSSKAQIILPFRFRSNLQKDESERTKSPFSKSFSKTIDESSQKVSIHLRSWVWGQGFCDDVVRGIKTY